MARTRAAQKVERRKSSGVAVLPGKLTDCASDDPDRNELFIVEGDSAGGSAKQARDKEFQAVLPLKGKPKNTWQDSADTLYSNKEIEAIALAIGVDHHKLERHGRSVRPALQEASSSSPTPTWTARTSRCCCSRSSSGTSRS